MKAINTKHVRTLSGKRLREGTLLMLAMSGFAVWFLVYPETFAKSTGVRRRTPEFVRLVGVVGVPLFGWLLLAHIRETLRRRRK